MTDSPDTNRENRREDIDIEDDETRDLFLENKSSWEVDEAQVEQEPVETIGQYEPYLLKKWRIIAESIESLHSEDDCPENDSRYDKWDELFVANIGNSELHKRDTIGDTAKVIWKHIGSPYRREFE